MAHLRIIYPQNFCNKKSAHRIKEATPEIDEDVFDMFDDQKNKTTSKTENEIMAGLRQTKYKQRPNSSRVTKRSHLNTANGKRVCTFYTSYAAYGFYLRNLWDMRLPMAKKNKKREL